MVNLNDYEAYWQSVKLRLPEIKTLEIILSEKDMGEVIQGLKKGDEPVLFVTVPSGDNDGDIDNDMEKNISLLFLLSKYDSQGKVKAIGTVKELQPLFEEIKDMMKYDSSDNCGIMAHLEIDSMHSDPEYKLYSDMSGWSLSFVF